MARFLARLQRLDIPGIPKHIARRGNNRLRCFLDDTDWRRRKQEMNLTSFLQMPEPEGRDMEKPQNPIPFL